MHTMLQASLRTGLRSRSDIETVGPFLAAFDPDSDSPFRNYAVPDDGAAPTDAEIEDLRRAFVRRGRLPRFEFLPSAAPAVEDALVSAGFVTDARLPIMTCTPAQLRESAPPAGVDLDLAVDVDALREAAATQNAAYDASPPTEADVARLEVVVAAGGVVGLAREMGGRPVGSGLVTPAIEGFAEVAAVGVLPDWRRRGLAGALTGSLGRAAFDRGVDALMLMAYEAEQGIYARAGFTVASEIAFMSIPSAHG
jgi:ribosomal protein S18 acetylase RimI-like enzyme